MDWRFLAIQGLLFFLVVQVQNIGVGIIGGALMLFVWRRRWDQREAVIALFMVSCVLASSREPGLQYWKNLRLLPAALLLLEALKTFRHAQLNQRRSWTNWVIFILVLTGVPALLSEFATAGIEEALLLSSTWFTMLVTAQIHEHDRLMFRFNSLKHLAVIVIGVSMLYYVFESNLGFLNGRFRGVFGNPNEMSHWMFPFVLLIFSSSAFSNKSEKKWALIVGLGVLGLTGTRGALVSLLVGWLGAQIVKRKKSGFQVFLLGSILLGVASSQIFSFEVFQAFLPERLIRSESLEEGGGRFLAWEFALEEIKRRPFFGGGGGYEERYFGSRYAFFAQQNHQGLSHNSWLAFAMNFGVASSLLLILSLTNRLGLFKRSTIILFAPAFLFSLTIEGWLTAPMSASSPVLFFVGGFLGSKYKIHELRKS